MCEPNRTVSYDQCVEDVRRMARRTALLYHYFVTTLVDHLGEERAKTLTAEASPSAVMPSAATTVTLL